MKYQTFLMSWLAAGMAFPGAIALFLGEPAFAQAESVPEIFIEPVPPRVLPSETDGESLNLTPEVIERSPVLQRWMQEVPDLREDIRNDPSFVTRLYAGYSFFPSSGGTGGLAVGVEDVFLGDLPLTLSADYQQTFERSAANRRRAYGVDLNYYLLPLGDYFNVAPIVGYRYAESGSDYAVSGANVGVRLRFVPSRTGAADVTLDQSWVVGDREGLSVTHLNVGYAVTDDLRLSTDLEWQRTADEGDSRVGINLEWSL